MIHGRDLILSINGTPIAASTTCDLSTATDFIEVCAPTGGEWKDYIPTQHGWDVSAGCLMATMENSDNLLKMQKSKQRLELSFYDQGLQVFYKGAAYIKKLDIVGNYGNLAKMSVAFQACGELLTATEKSILMNSALTPNRTQISGKDITFGATGNIIINNQAKLGMYAVGVTISADTRITLPPKFAVIKGSLDDVVAWINNGNNTSLNANAISINSKGGKQSVVHKTTTTQELTFIAQYQYSIMSLQPTILSKF